MRVSVAVTSVAMLVFGSAIPAVAAPVFSSRSASEALVANCPSGPLGGVCDPNFVLGSGNFAGYSGVEDFKPTQFGLTAQSYAILKPTPESSSHGSAIAFSVSNPQTALPVLKVGAFTRSNELGRYATSYSRMATLAAFTYQGSDPLALSLVGNIDFDVTFAPIDYPAPLSAGSFPYSFAQLRGRLVIGTEALFQSTSIIPNPWQCGDNGVLASAVGFSGTGGFASGWGGTTHGLTLTLDASTACGSGSPVMIQPGQNFYIYGFLDALAIQGGIVNATNSMEIAFSPGTPPSVIEAFAANAIAVGVPEPASWAMLIAGFGLVGVIARRRRVLAG